jgi:hypothetical protein
MSNGTIAVITSQSSPVLVNIPVAPIRGFKRIGGTTKEASSTTSPTSPGKVVEVVLVVVEVSSTTGETEVSPPPHADTIKENTARIIDSFFLTLILNLYINVFNFQMRTEQKPYFIDFLH